jgi:hypothetical protein
VLPGLLQTEDYARAVLRAAPSAGPADAIDVQVALRMERQTILSQDEPPGLWVVLSESVLRVQVGGPYLEHLTGSLLLENAEEVARYSVVFDHLRAEALGTAQSAGLIAQVADGSV